MKKRYLIIAFLPLSAFIYFGVNLSDSKPKNISAPSAIAKNSSDRSGTHIVVEKLVKAPRNNAVEIEKVDLPHLLGNKSDKVIQNADVQEAGSREPSLANMNAPATGEFADQIEFGPNKDDCIPLCANTANINAPAQDEFADQINTDAIQLQATQKGIDLALPIKLIDVPANSHPPTALGVYTPAPESKE